jgi:hypothetical protein
VDPDALNYTLDETRDGCYLQNYLTLSSPDDPGTGKDIVQAPIFLIEQGKKYSSQPT